MFVTNARKKLIFNMEDVYFCPDYKAYRKTATVTTFYNSPIQSRYSVAHDTLLVDLYKTEEELLAEISESTRRMIRKNLKDGEFKYEFFTPGKQDFDEFEEFYNIFANTKGLPLFRRDSIECINATGNIVMAKTTEISTGQICVYKMFICGNDRVVAHHECSVFHQSDSPNERNRLAKASKTFTYVSFLHFKEAGIRWFDLGGLSLNKHSDNREGIDTYKLRFGGATVREYHLFVGKGIAGKILAWMYFKKNANY